MAFLQGDKKKKKKKIQAMQTFYSSALHDVTTQGSFVNNLVPPILGILCNDVGGHWKNNKQ